PPSSAWRASSVQVGTRNQPLNRHSGEGAEFLHQVVRQERGRFVHPALIFAVGRLCSTQQLSNFCLQIVCLLTSLSDTGHETVPIRFWYHAGRSNLLKGLTIPS